MHLILNSDSVKPIYIQISEWLETEILNGTIEPQGKMYSQYQLADMFTINPATAAKGLSLLVEEDILFKKRGLGMFVSDHAKEIILSKRKNQTLKALIQELVKEAEHLQVSTDELVELIRIQRQEIKGDEG